MLWAFCWKLNVLLGRKNQHIWNQCVAAFTAMRLSLAVSWRDMCFDSTNIKKMWRQWCWKPNNIRYCICTTLPLLSTILYIMIIYLHVKIEKITWIISTTVHYMFNTCSHGPMPSSLGNFCKQTYFGVFMLHPILKHIQCHQLKVDIVIMEYRTFYLRIWPLNN